MNAVVKPPAKAAEGQPTDAQGVTEIVALVDVLVDAEGTQIRDKLDEAHVRTLVGVLQAHDDDLSEVDGIVLDGDGQPIEGMAVGFRDLIEVDHVRGRLGGKDVFHLVSGFHRVEAARRAGKLVIGAIVFPDRGQAYREWRAGKANGQHGKRLKPKERKEQLRRYIRANLHRHPGPRGGRANGELKSVTQMCIDNDGIDIKTFWKWIKVVSYPTWRALTERTGYGDEWNDNPNPEYDPDMVREAQNSRKLERAVTLAVNIANTLDQEMSLRRAEELLEKALKDVSAMLARKMPDPFA
ncbi:hypothetical protein [Mesorhizobium sp. B2-6-1]|uniref:hypothetical protein n=1 Tax=Mesorhizobium sp. B2-6-1 TaxID=2589916 RepID=UPI00112E8E14|nr:hypothetical protein [Mesorhizobium sp. B2-6-1]TPJ59962.1 hypothetical protein FJ443_22480 [Mesorhizobium sp. B2-6-1]